MLKIGHLLKFLSEINPHTSPVKLALFNFIKAFYTPDEVLTKAFFESFFCHTLDYSHWYANKTHLSHELLIILKNFNGLFQNKLDLSAITFPDQIQVFEIDQQKNCQDVLFKYLQSLSSSKIQVKVCLDQKKFLGFSLDENGKLSVFQLDKKFIIRNSQLEPLRNDLCLKYTPQLELENEQMFFFEISPHHLIKFKIKNEKVSGVITRGYMFQKVQEFTDLKIHEIPRLFWPLKRAEQFFITRESDPFYSDLVKKLTDISQGIWEKNSESWQKYMSILLSQSDSALENVYIGDKRLEELILNVRNILLSEKSEVCQNIQPLKPKIPQRNLELG